MTLPGGTSFYRCGAANFSAELNRATHIAIPLLLVLHALGIRFVRLLPSLGVERVVTNSVSDKVDGVVVISTEKMDSGHLDEVLIP
jgi:hypothetical protein